MTPPDAALIVRAASLYLPVSVACGLGVTRARRAADRRLAAAVVAGLVWQLVALLAVNQVAVAQGWWQFRTAGGAVAGMPVDLWLGWTVLWGAVPVLLSADRLAVVAVGLVAGDFIVMPRLGAVIDLAPRWILGELLAVAVALLPGTVLAWLTVHGVRPAWRATLQLLAFAGVTGYLVPSLAFAVVGGDWHRLVTRPRWQLVVAAVIVAPVASMAVQAVMEFAAHGGTPLPLDPPSTLVTTGPYAYVANPMQLGGTVLLAAWGLVLEQPGVIAATVVAALFSAGYAAWSEHTELSARFGEDWGRYRTGVRLWVPRWRPYVGQPAVVYAGTSCDPCSEVGRFLTRRHRRRLDVLAAETSGRPMVRITYVRGVEQATGVAAVGRALEHVHLGWAALSWVARVPGVEAALQVVADVAGAGPLAAPIGGRAAPEPPGGAAVPGLRGSSVPARPAERCRTGRTGRSGRGVRSRRRRGTRGAGRPACDWW
ncbi:MAG: isoprenylcysteine carboxylmethyltransferase family protein [Actinobacteria bacterium]|nr:isoprenylcysteine carboxylmethyltransferase family protein [Actinomycetota bacterium]